MERMLVSSASAFVRCGVENVVVGQGDLHPYADEMRAAGLAVYEMPPIGSSFTAARELRRIVRCLRIQVVHLHTEGRYLPSVLSIWAALGFHRRIVRTVHSIFDPKGSDYYRRLCQAVLGDRLVSVVVAPSTDVARIESRFFRNCELVNNWVDERFWDLRRRRLKQYSPGSPPVAVIVGNCSQVKQHERALRALLHTDFRLIHLGNEKHAGEEELELLWALENQGRLVARGVGVPDDALLIGDLFLMPSAYEGMGVALAEALVTGVPAVVNNVPGLQWARDLPATEFVADNDAAWIEHLSAWTASSDVRTEEELPSIDLSPLRGAAQYAEIYRRLVVG